MVEELGDLVSGVRWTTDTGSGAIADHGAQVLTWQPVGLEPVVWMSAHALITDGVAIRGGVPICFPWFGPGRSGDMTPAHGFARTTLWRRVEVMESEGLVRVVHELDQGLATAPSFDVPYRVRSTVNAGAELAMELLVENTGSAPFTFEAALHTYLAVGDVREVQIDGLAGASFLDKVRGVESVQEGSITVAGEVDRVYDSEGTVEVVDPVLGRIIRVVKTGSSSTIVWNPWVEKSQALADFGDDEWQRMVCVETANVGDHAVTLAPGEGHVMSATLAVSPT